VEGLSGENSTLHEKRANFMIVRPAVVMAGLVPAIHAAPLQTTLEVRDGLWAWMPGTRPGKTW
jgi:hypothetical protein